SPVPPPCKRGGSRVPSRAFRQAGCRAQDSPRRALAMKNQGDIRMYSPCGSSYSRARADGHSVACLERMLPVRRDQLVQLEWPPIGTPQEISGAISTIFTAIGEG